MEEIDEFLMIFPAWNALCTGLSNAEIANKTSSNPSIISSFLYSAILKAFSARRELRLLAPCLALTAHACHPRNNKNT